MRGKGAGDGGGDEDRERGEIRERGVVGFGAAGGRGGRVREWACGR